MPIRVVICWPDISGYMAACWRELAARPEIDLTVVALRHGGTEQTAFTDELVRDLPCVMIEPEQQQNPQWVAEMIAARKPAVVYIPGWFVPCFRDLPSMPALREVQFVMGMDTPLKRNWRQALGRPLARRFVRRMARVLVAGERSWQYARYLGVPEARIARGCYGYDWNLFAPVLERRLSRADGWPKRFLYLGRYAPEKGLDVLLEAYGQYRGAVAEPWPLTCCGKGPLASLLVGRAGVEDRGFVQPAEQPTIMEQCGAFVLTSLYEPWGVAIGEVAASGLPVLCSEACGASVELVRSYYNGLTVATGDVSATVAGLRWLHDNHARLAEMGRHGREISRASGAGVWADRWVAMAGQLGGSEAKPAITGKSAFMKGAPEQKF